MFIAHFQVHCADFERSGIEQVEQAHHVNENIDRDRKMLDLLPLGHPARLSLLNRLASGLSFRFAQTGQMQDFDEAFERGYEGLALQPPGHPERPAFLKNLAIRLGSRFRRTGQIQDVEEAIEYDRESLSLQPLGHQHRDIILSNLASHLSSRFERTGQMQDLEEAIQHNREALALRAPDHPDRATSHSHLANCLRSRFRRTRQIQDLEEAIEHDRKTLALRDPGHPHRRISYNNLVLDLIISFQRTGQMQDLQEATLYARASRALRTPVHAYHALTLHNLATCLTLLYMRTWQMQSLEEAIELRREALALQTLDHVEFPAFYIHLAAGLGFRFRRTGKIENIEEAIELARKALALQPSGHPDHDSSLISLAALLRLRFNRTGQMQDIAEAIEHNREALTLQASGHPDRAHTFDRLAADLSSRFDRSGQMQDLEEAIQHAREALALQTPGHPNRASFLNTLATQLSSRFERTGQMQDLEEAIEFHREALALRPPSHPDRPWSLFNLAVGLKVRFRRRGQMQDLEEAIEYHREVLNICSQGPDHITFLSGFSLTLLTRFETTYTEGDLREALDMFAVATESRPASAGNKLSVAELWVKAARKFGHDSLLSAYAKYLSLLQHSLVIGPSLQFQWESLTRNSPSIAVDAASSSIGAGQLDVAIEMLEQGRALLWSRMKGYRQPVKELRAVNETLADEFETVSNQIEQLAISQSLSTSDASEIGPQFSTAWDEIWSEQRRLSDRWDAIVRQIRQIEGFSDFLQPVPFGRLKHAAAEGPVIIVNVSSYRSDALILRDATSYPTLVPLMNSLYDEVGKLSDQFGQVHRQDENATAAVMHDVLRALWTLVAQPVIDSLQVLGVAEKSRIWWCPTGKVCSLPLHAAHPLITGERGLLDIFVSSYTPTLSSLISARQDIALKRSTYPQILTVGQTDDSLRRVDEELNGISDLGNFVDTIVEGQALPFPCA